MTGTSLVPKLLGCLGLGESSKNAPTVQGHLHIQYVGICFAKLFWLSPDKSANELSLCGWTTLKAASMDHGIVSYCLRV